MSCRLTVPSPVRDTSVRPNDLTRAIERISEDRNCGDEEVFDEARDNSNDACSVGADDDDVLDDIYLEVRDATPEEREAMRAYVEATSKAKFLFDGENMIKIKPKKATALKAVFGKAFWLHKKLKERRRANIKFDGYVWDYIPQSGYKVPSVLTYCIGEIEVRDFTRNGIYSLGGNQEEVRKIKKRFLEGKVPDLQDTDTHVLANVVYNFLRELREPLIPAAMRNSFMTVGQTDCMDERVEKLKELVVQLPEVNRATLGYLIRHFQYVSSCPRSMMPLANLARVFGSVIIGTKVPERELPCTQEYIWLIETMYGLLMIEPGFFLPFIN